jgi:hypothetical protein
MSSPRTTTRSSAQREEEVKEAGAAISETLSHGLEQGKEMLSTVTHNGADKMLALALLLHAAINMWQGYSLLFMPEMIVPGLFGGWFGSGGEKMGEKLGEKLQEKFGIGEKLAHGTPLDTSAQHSILRAFGFQVRAAAARGKGVDWERARHRATTTILWRILRHTITYC